MLSGKDTISHYSSSNVSIWMAMAFQAGLLNIGGFMACHRMVSHITGFATYFGYEMSQSRHQDALGVLLVPLFFLFGSILSGFMVDIRIKLQEKPQYYMSFGIMFLLVLVVLVGGVNGYFGVFAEPLESTRDYILLALICLVCGIQNGTITSVSRSVVRTTHLTGITTDLGIGLVRVLHRHRLKGQFADEVSANLMRVGIIGFFGLGSLMGAFIFKDLGYWGFVVPTLTSGLLFFTTLYYQILKPRRLARGAVT